MPQMAPLNWLTLMVSFSVILITFNILNFYSFQLKMKQKKTQTKKMITNWKW